MSRVHRTHWPDGPVEGRVPIGTEHLIPGRVVRFRISDNLYVGTRRIDVAGLDPLGRLAGDYIRAETTLELPPKGLQ